MTDNHSRDRLACEIVVSMGAGVRLTPWPYPAPLLKPRYDPDHAPRRGRLNGSIKWAGAVVLISEAPVGELAGIEETDTGDWVVKVFDVTLDGWHRPG